MTISSNRPSGRRHHKPPVRLHAWAALITAVALLVSAASGLIALMRG